MTPARTEEFARIADQAALNLQEITMLTAIEPFDVQEGYAIQRALVALRIGRGERIVGMKMGLTSHAKMQQMGVSEPIYGVLTDVMMLEDGGALSMSKLIHPRIEPEIAFILKDDLHGPVTADQALAAVGGVCAALEVIDSRYRDFKFTLPDVIADNTSAAFVILGNIVPVPENLGNLGIILEINGQTVETASSAAVLDHPAHSLAVLAGMLARDGDYLHAGQVVLSGGATAAMAISAGDVVRAIVDEVGTASVRGEK